MTPVSVALSEVGLRVFWMKEQSSQRRWFAGLLKHFDTPLHLQRWPVRLGHLGLQLSDPLGPDGQGRPRAKLPLLTDMHVLIR